MAELSIIQQTFYHLGVALAIGLLIGLERGWRERKREEGQRVAGIRTFGLIGLLGGVSGLLGVGMGAWFPAAAFLALAAVQVSAYLSSARRNRDVGITTLVAGLLTFALGVLAVTGQTEVAGAFAVVTAMVLRLKPQIHEWVAGLEPEEIHAGLMLLLISVVLLPILPNQGYGPWGALNPYAIWWMVVLIAAISFIGYFAIKIGGAGKGIVFTGLFAGLMSSTALTLQFSRMARVHPSSVPTLAIGILLACATMFPRMVLVTWILSPKLVQFVWQPAALMALVVYGAVAFLWWRETGRRSDAVELSLNNPLELKSALSFGCLLATIMLLGEWLKSLVGAQGVLALSVASGVADVDAITLSLAKMSREGLALQTAALGIVLAAAANSLVKAGMAVTVGGGALGRMVGLALTLAALLGTTAAWVAAG